MQSNQKVMQLDCTELGMVMTIVKTSKDTGGKSLEMEWTLSPNSGGTPVHIHPAAIEIYEILSGELEIFKKGKWIDRLVNQSQFGLLVIYFFTFVTFQQERINIQKESNHQNKSSRYIDNSQSQ